ncbi:MAG: hypothetical protein WAM61_11830 [Desulfobacterales bacterium]
MAKRDEFVTKMKARLDDWNQEFDSFEKKIQKLKADMTAKYESQIEELRRKRREGDQKLAQIRTAGEGTWEHLKAETENAWVAMKEALAAFKAHYKKERGAAEDSSEDRR